MNVYEISFAIIWGVWVSIPIVLAVTGQTLNHWTRGRYSPRWCSRFQRFKYKSVWTSYWDDSHDTQLTYILLDGLGAFFLLGLIHVAASALGADILYVILGVLAIISTYVLPRYLLDAWEALRMSWKTGKSERLDELEEQLRELKRGRDV